MALQFVTDQIKDDAINAAKIASSTITSAQVALGGAFAFSGALSSSAVPNSPNDVANKTYVDNIAAGLHWKDSVKAATTANLDLAGTETIDGISILAGDRVLVKNQTTASANGIYVCVTPGAWTRATDMDTSAEFSGAAMFVRQGTTQADTGWVCTNDADPNVGTDAIAFAQFSGGGTMIGGDGITVAGNAISVDLKDTGSGLDFAGGELGIASSSVSNAMLAGSIANDKLSNSAVTLSSGTGLTGGGSLSLGGNLTLNVGGLTNAEIANAAAIVDTKLATIATSNKVSGSAVQINGSNATIEDSTGLRVKLAADKGLEAATGGLQVKLDGATLALASGGISVATGGVANAQIATNAAIADTKLGTIATSNKVSGSAVQLASSNATLENATGLQVKLSGSGGVQAIAAGLSLKLVGTTLSMDANGLKVPSAGITPLEMSIQPRKDGFSGNGSADAFNLTTRILDNDWLDGALVTRNGQVLNQVASSPTGVEEYTVTDNGAVSTITFGTAPSNGDDLRVLYFA
jgi:hypothetical protein